MEIKNFINNFDMSNPDWDNLPQGFPNCDLDNLEMNEIGKFMGIKTTWELYHPAKTAQTSRNWKGSQGYKAIASWQTGMLLRDLLVPWFKETRAENSRNFPSIPVNFRLFDRLEAQVLDAARSVIANIEEGYTRPDTKAYLQFLGYSQASLAEVRGDIERMKEDEILKSVKGSTLLSIGIKTPTKDIPYPPQTSRKQTAEHGNLREYAGKEILMRDLTYETFIELINKTDFLLQKLVASLEKKLENTKNGLISRF